MAAAEDTIHDVGTGDGNARIPIVYHGAYAPYSAQQPGAGKCRQRQLATGYAILDMTGQADRQLRSSSPNRPPRTA